MLEGRKVIQRVVERVRSYRPPPDKVKAGSVSKERSELFYLPKLVLVRYIEHHHHSQFRFVLAMALLCFGSKESEYYDEVDLFSLIETCQSCMISIDSLQSP